MKQFTLKSLLLMLTIFLGGVNAWGETYQHVFTKKPSIGSNDLSGVSWNIAATNLNSYNSQNYAGVQIGSKSSDGSITLTSSSDWSYNGNTKITEVRLWLNMGGTSVTPSVKIGGIDAISDGTKVVKNSKAGSDYTKATKVTFTPADDANSGVVVINVETVNAGYVCAMEIDCETDAGGTETRPSVPTFSLADGTYWKEQTLELTTKVEGGTILYTTDGSDPTTPEKAIVYSAPLTISETTTVKACVKDAEGNFSNVVERTYTFVPSIANTPEKAYTVAEAIALIGNTSAEQLAAEKVYVKGVVSKVDSYNSTYKSITYWLDGNSFEVYSGRALGNEDFSEEVGINAVEVGAKVVICGHIKQYKTTYEFDKENYLVSYTAPERASLPATDGTANYATFSSDRPVEFVDATVYAVNVVNGVLQLNEVTSKQVPADTGVLLKSEKETAPYFYIDEAATIDNNLLKPASLMPASQEMSGSDKFYKLAYDNYEAKTGLGFYWGAENGGVFTVKAGTAYLAVPAVPAVPNTASVKGFLLDGTPTAIEGVEAENNTDVIYNLSGQRVQKAQRGLYIVNGKKLMVK